MEMVTIGGEGVDARDQLYHRLAACHGHWWESGEEEGCDVMRIDDTLVVNERAMNSLGDAQMAFDREDPCDADALRERGFDGGEIASLYDFGGCSIFEPDLLNVWWKDQLRAGETWCMYYAPQRSGFGTPQVTRQAVVIDRCDLSQLD